MPENVDLEGDLGKTFVPRTLPLHELRPLTSIDLQGEQTLPELDVVRAGEEEETSFTRLVSQQPHPLGVKPIGNFYLSSQDSGPTPHWQAQQGLGTWAALLRDEPFLLDVLATFDHITIAKLSQCSKSMYCYANAQEVWRALTVRDFGANGGFRQFDSPSWKRAYLRWTRASPLPPSHQESLIISGIYSDHLYAAWRCTIAPLSDLCGVKRDNLPRRCGLSKSDFIAEFEAPNKPVILQGLMQGWSAMQKWSLDYLTSVVGEDHLFRAEAVDLSLSSYQSYASVCQEEAPLYLFDKKFTQGSAAPLAADFNVPEHFDDDLFTLLGTQRPDFQWLIIGPARSGSTFHLDPNSTNAWNAVIEGRKKWILFPPHTPPPGIFPSRDGAEVTSPVSVTEWYLNHYPLLQNMLVTAAAEGKDVPFYEGICEPGDIMFVPCGWWHCVINLEPSIAITQNYVSPRNLRQVLRFLRDKGDQVSGFACEENDDALVGEIKGRRELYDVFVEKLKSSPLVSDLESLFDSRDDSNAGRKRVKRDDSSCLARVWSEIESRPCARPFSFSF